MFRLLRKYTKDGWWATLLGPIFTVAEVVVDALIPLVMSDIIDKGIYGMGGNMEYIWGRGVHMVLLAVLGAVFGALSGLFSSIASTRFIRNIRSAMFAKVQEYSFENIEKYPVPTVVMRMTTDMRMLRMAYVSIVRMLIRAPFNLAMSAYFVRKNADQGTVQPGYECLFCLCDESIPGFDLCGCHPGIGRGLDLHLFQGTSAFPPDDAEIRCHGC